MVEAAEILDSHDREVVLIIAPRYANRRLPLSDKSMEEEADRIGIPYHYVNDINIPKERAFLYDKPGKLALCFGPAWIFKRETRDGFEFGMLNYNAIPQPRYVGGAHHSWQIMNGNLEGGCVVQEIGPEIDHGDIIHAAYYKFPKTVRTPLDYVRYRNGESLKFVRKFLAKLLGGEVFSKTNYEKAAQEKLYFPRLLTEFHAYVDWRWVAADVAAFCCAFAEPLNNAMTYLRGKRVTLRDVELVETCDRFHPFCYGLIVRNTSEGILVAANGGLVKIAAIGCPEDALTIHTVREGDRLYTPLEVLDRATRTAVSIEPDGSLFPVTY